MSERSRKSLKERVIAETKAYLMVSAYLAVFLAVFVNYRMLVLREYNVAYFQFGFAIVEALILGKLIIIGRALGFGRRFDQRPLIVPTLYKTLCFGVLVVAFNILEHVLTGALHKEGAEAVYEGVVARGKWEILARLLMMVTAFLPLFATWEIGRVMGEGTLVRLFFGHRTAGAQSGAERGKP